ncbi:hypothetical protein FHS39_000720 [Streptomyces olivoverticillatus]|uniref:Extensin n=1 Tax=Streptomyces olivoverticillatus TaxID=66427 RepID=A0A7W7LK60_9ACTN|nr:hypothetical protein [Streptomyces olivoverticillatus]MBB4891720.1 hypothetical protein [Streptomyces olivoverticillatus]
MADDHRYDWLDDDAVERLLRGERVADDTPPAGAEELSAALLSLTAHEPSPGSPLPGEEAALAAFRQARAQAPAPRARFGARAGAFGERAGAARSFLRLPVRTALALTLAGCAVGGVAVAAGTGVLPGPFGRAGREPAPASSVAAAEDSGTETVAPGTAGPDATPSGGATGSARPSGRPDAHTTPGSGHGSPSGKASEPGTGPSATPRHDGDGTTGNGHDGHDGDNGTATGTVWAKLCRDYLATSRQGGTVNEDDERTLERTAGGGPSVVREFCERLLAAPDGKGAAGGGGTARDGGVKRDGSGILPRTSSSGLLVLPDVATLGDPGNGAAATPGTTGVASGVTFSGAVAL